MEPRWYELAVQQLEEDYADGLMTAEEFRGEMRALNAELRDAAAEAAQDAYDDYMGN